ncbi:4-hydroxyphenylacetate 3-monooxygenase reductase component [Vibrio maritimus]|uniref:4-hydroxyphenylacetate 3-monooxygenase reductase component n=1 Tax=Vibrio maritimus TaxID=990268 RepID=A0A090RRN8_9VIBR|nr:4-hydroxyphenylacetate 3-monooxygenase reductase component [Vibrio maritimus]
MSLQQEFRNAMSKLAAAVNIVTTGGEAGTLALQPPQCVRLQIAQRLCWFV